MDSQIVIQRLNEVNERQRRTIDSLLNLIDRQNDMIRQQQEIVRDKYVNDFTLPDELPKMTLTEAYERMRLDESIENKIDLSAHISSDKVKQDTNKQPNQDGDEWYNDEELSKRVKSIQIFYDEEQMKLLYMLTTYSEKDMLVIAKRHLLRQNCGIGEWSCNDLDSYLCKTFAVSYDWITSNMPTILDKINSDDCFANIAKYIHVRCTNRVFDNNGTHVYIKFHEAFAPGNIIREYKYVAERFIKYYEALPGSTYDNIKLHVSKYAEIYGK